MSVLNMSIGHCADSSKIKSNIVNERWTIKRKDWRATDPFLRQNPKTRSSHFVVNVYQSRPASVHGCSIHHVKSHRWAKALWGTDNGQWSAALSDALLLVDSNGLGTRSPLIILAQLMVVKICSYQGSELLYSVKESVYYDLWNLFLLGSHPRLGSVSNAYK